MHVLHRPIEVTADAGNLAGKENLKLLYNSSSFDILDKPLPPINYFGTSKGSLSTDIRFDKTCANRKASTFN